jgi:hypothetical protein
MNSITEIMSVESAAGSGTPLPRLFKICYLIAITVATFGWLSAFGWITIRIAKWLWA